MKKIFVFLSVILLLANSEAALASSSKNLIAADPEATKINQQVDDLKNKVASKVAELKLVEKRGIIGIVESVSDSHITVDDLNGNTRLIDVDEFTKFSSSDDSSFGLSDIKKGTKIAALGLYNKESEKLLARFINETTLPVFLHGVLSEKDPENFTLTLTLEDGTKYLVDVENITKTFSYSDGDLETLGFSKIKLMTNAVVVGFPNAKEKNRITASRIILFPDLPKNPKIPVVEQSPTPTQSTKPTSAQ